MTTCVFHIVKRCMGISYCRGGIIFFFISHFCFKMTCSYFTSVYAKLVVKITLRISPRIIVMSDNSAHTFCFNIRTLLWQPTTYISKLYIVRGFASSFSFSILIYSSLFAFIVVFLSLLFLHPVFYYSFSTLMD